MRLEDYLSVNALRAPDAVAAFEHDGRSSTYAELDAHSGDISAALIALGVGPGDRVGLCAPKGLDSLACVFGVLKAGGAYVPVDHHAPTARNAYILEDCAVRALVVEAAQVEALRAELAGEDWTTTAFPDAPSWDSGLVLLSRRETRAPTAQAPADLAYILYTSGSTGRPKGVMHTHASAMAFIDWCSDELQPTAADRFSSHAPFHFDLSILDIYVPLKHGAAVVLIGAEAGKQPGVLAEIITARAITVWYSTPSILRMLVEFGDLAARECSALRIVCYAGEVFPVKHLRAIQALWPRPAYYNLYGPTETNVCTFHRLAQTLPEDLAAIPIGRVCSGDRARLVAPDGAPAGTGQEGELLIAGGSVMAGYWNLPDRNAEAFVRDADGDWYRTGDIVRLDAAGEYVFVGRRDRMIKRRGYRVELGEIEAALHRHPSITEAAVVAQPASDGEMTVTAFIAWNAEAPPSTIKLKQFSAQNLLAYMVPDRFSILPSLPKTSTDKIDYQRLKDGL